MKGAIFFMYTIGEIVVYGNTGVCRVVDIAPSNRPNTGGAIYYTLKPLYQDGLIYAPVDSDKLYIRRVITREQAERLIDTIPDVHVDFCQSNNRQQLIEKYQAAFSTHDCADLVELIKTIYHKRQYAASRHRRLGQLDIRYMKRAEELLYGEFSVALGIPKDEVHGYIERRIGKR